jgi:hypothetical protein
MDSSKLLEIIDLLEADEKEYTLSTKLDEVSNLITTQNNAEVNEQIEEKLKILQENIAMSRASLFAQTEIKILKNLGVENYFGRRFIENIQKNVNARGYEVSAKFKQFSTTRTEKYNKLIKMRNVMVETGLSPYEQTKDEIAMSIPSNISNTAEVAKYLEKFGQLIQIVQECKETKDIAQEPPKITRLNKGSAEFFILAEPNTISAIIDILAGLSTVYLVTKELRNRKSGDSLNDLEQKEIKKIYEGVAKRKLEEFITETVEKISGKVEPEKQARLRTYIKFLIKWLPLGVKIEVVYKKSVEPLAGDPKESVTQQKLLKRQHNEQLKVAEIYKLPIEQLKLPEPDDKSEVKKITTTKEEQKKQPPAK